VSGTRHRERKLINRINCFLNSQESGVQYGDKKRITF
jgi:hypothetical protein